MDNALENENLNQGEINDNVGQDEATQNKESGSDWQSQAKYFQSEKDKLYTENQNLRKYEQVGKMLESRPDIVQTVSGMLQGGQPAQDESVSLDKDEFDPWEAYNDPSSKSYQFRQQELQSTINKAVESQVSNKVAGVQEQVGMNQLTSELEKRGLNKEEIQSFYKFAKTNPAEFGVDGALNMWQSVTQQPTEGEQNNENPLDSIRQNQSVPRQAGILSGEKPIRTDEKDDMWKGILQAGSRSKVL
tara:strand:- start:1100 stop:1837 length:738 start_codon:yes stop_codon:yes gene_type:complete